ncbi:MAG: hypothetical protein IT356_05570 [Gemmatimonadaceae bacterium]|nr:hypothetical protein [Gemmatimonadaceae bacterium]
MRSHFPVQITRAAFAAAVAVCAARAARAQSTAAPSSMPPIRPLGKVVAASAELLGAVSQVRALPDGRVLVNDNRGRKVALFDPSLSSFTVVADTTSATANAYSSRAGGLIAYKGDSTLFVDPSSLSMLVLDGKGKVARVMSIPRPQEASYLIGGPNGTPGFDAQGRLVYRGRPDIQIKQAPPGAANSIGGMMMPTIPDSAALLRIDLATRKVDTLIWYKTEKQDISVRQTPEGRMSISTTINPMQYLDAWAVTSDGRVAVVRARDYHVDWVDADGKVASSGKVPFAWRHLDDSAKTAYIDSTRAVLEKMREDVQKRVQQGGMAAIDAMASDLGGVMGGMAEVRMGSGGSSRGTANAPPARGGAAAGISLPPVNMVKPSELPDYAPPFEAGSVRADEDGNIWIRTTNVYDGGSVYDIVNGQGKLTDRVLLPPGRVIAGFARGGVVFMGVRDGEGDVRLEKATLR